MIKCLLSLVALLSVVASGVADETVKHTTDSVATVKKNLAAEKAVLLDIREKGEWDEGHLELAKLVPLSGLKALGAEAKEVEGVGKDKIVYLHCRSGRRVLSAAPILKELGYDVRPLKLGYSALLKEGFEQADE